MKRRSTFISTVEEPLSPHQIRISNDSLEVHSLKAAHEERITVGYNELPQELWLVLKQSHELHIRWASPRPYISTAPFVSRISPGFHAFFTPIRNKPIDLFCPQLRKVFGESLKCDTPESTFIAPSVASQRFANSASLQYYDLLPSIGQLVEYIQAKICRSSDVSCHEGASSLLDADYLDIDYDSISHALTLNAFWSHAPNSAGWTQRITKDISGSDSVEVGVLNLEKSTDPEELKLGGFLTVVGEDDKPHPTLFSFPSRHHPLPQPAIFATTFDSPTGLHPTLRLTFPPQSLTPPPISAACYLHTYLTLPSPLFLDRYQLSDSLFLQSHRLGALHSLTGESDLEAPDWTIRRWGSASLFEIFPPPPPQILDAIAANKDDELLTVSIPLHLRYLEPHPDGHRDIHVPDPVVFWACRAEEGAKMSANPFDRVNVGYEAVFGPKTMFFHLNPVEAITAAAAAAAVDKNNLSSSGSASQELIQSVSVPVLNVDIHANTSGSGAGLFQMSTVFTILAGFCWVCWCLFKAVKENEGGSSRGTRAGKDKMKMK